MPGFVVGGAPSISLAHDDAALGAQHELFERVTEVAHGHAVAASARGQQCGLVGEVREVRSDHPCAGRGEALERNVVRQGHPARVHLEDPAPAEGVGRLHRNAPVETAGAQQRGVEHVGAVRRGEHDHAGLAIEAVHLGEDLIERLLALVVAPADASERAAAGTPDRVELVDEHDRGRSGLRLGEEVAHSAGADADDHLDELRGRDREERHVRLAGHGAREQRLARAGETAQQHPARDPPAEPAIAFGVAQEIDDLRQLVGRLVDARHVGKRHPRPLAALIALRAGTHHAAHASHAASGGASHQDHHQADEEQRWQEADEQRPPPGRGGLERIRVHHHAARAQLREQRAGIGERRDLGLEAGDRLRLGVSWGEVADGASEGSLQCRAARGDRRQVARGDLLQKERAVRDTGMRSRARRRREREDPVDGHEDDDRDEHRAQQRWRGPGRSRCGAAAVL